MRQILPVAILLLFSANAHASCRADAAARNLSGAELADFMRKCQLEAAAMCDRLATERKVGRERLTFIRKCYNDAVR